jgi:hypothetical protein
MAQCKACKANLKDQGLMDGECVQNLVVLTADSMEEQWTELTTQMALYFGQSFNLKHSAKAGEQKDYASH